MTLRAAVHVHSDWSDDGLWTLADLARGFARRRYEAVLLAEHDRGWDQHRWDAYREACRLHSTPATILVPGIEYGDPDDVVHVTVWGDVPFLGAGRSTLDILREARYAGAMTVLAHPRRRRAHDRFTAEWAPLLDGVEVWNRKYDGWAPSRDALELAAAYPQLRLLAGNDFHTRRQFFPFGLILEAPPSLEGIYGSLAAGSYRVQVFRRELRSYCSGAPLGVAEHLEALRLRVAVPLRKRRRRRRTRA